MVSRATRTRSTSSRIGAPPIFILTALAPSSRLASISRGQAGQALAFFVVAAGDISGHAVAEAAQQLIRGFAGRLAHQVPERDIDAADETGGDAAPAHQLRYPERMPDAAVIERVLADQQRS